MVFLKSISSWSYQMAFQQFNRQWGNLDLLRLGAFSFGLNGLILAMDVVILPFLVLLLASEELKNTYVGLLGLSGLGVAALVQAIVGRISDRTQSPLGRRIPYLLWGCTFICIGLIALGLVSNLLTLFLVWLFIQFNVNIAYGPYQALIRDLVPINRIGIASSLKILADAAGGAFLITISAILIGRYAGTGTGNWLWPILALLGATLISATIITSVLVRTKEIANDSLTSPWTKKIDRSTGLHPQLSRFVISRFLMVTAISVFMTYGLFFLNDVVKLENPAQALGFMIPIIAAAFLFVPYPAGWLSDRIGRKPVVLAGAFGAAIGSMSMLSATNMTDVLIIACVIGMSLGALLSANLALANDLGTRGREGQHMGIVNLATVSGAALAKLLGPGVDLLNQVEAEMGYTTLLIGCSILFVTGAILLIPLKIGRPNISLHDR
jgi:MFS family permease